MCNHSISTRLRLLTEGVSNCDSESAGLGVGAHNEAVGGRPKCGGVMVSIRDESSSVFRSVLNGFVNKQIPVIVPTGIHDSSALETGNACDMFPAQMEDFITVGASALGDGRAPFSSLGPSVNLYTPAQTFTPLGIPAQTRPGLCPGLRRQL